MSSLRKFHRPKLFFAVNNDVIDGKKIDIFVGAKVSTLVKVNTRIFDHFGEMINQKSLIFEKLVSVTCFFTDFGQKSNDLWVYVHDFLGMEY